MKAIITRNQSVTQTQNGKLTLFDNQGIKIFECVTLELPYIKNERKISSIPIGSYYCKKIKSPKFGNVFSIMNVENRTNILIHAGNYKKDTLGCILLGSEKNYNPIEKEYYVLHSQTTLAEFMMITHKTIELLIK